MRKNFSSSLIHSRFKGRSDFDERSHRLRLLKGVFALLLFALLFLPSSSVTACAEEKEDLSSYVVELLESLNLDELHAYLQETAGFEGVDIREKLLQMITEGESVNYRDIFSQLKDFIFSEVKNFIPAFVVVLSSVIACGIIKNLKSGVLHSTMSDIIEYVCFLCVGSVILASFTSLIKIVFTSLQALKRQSEIVYPILLTLMASSGGSVSVSVFRPAVAFFGGGVVEVFLSFVFPLSVFLVVASFIGNLSEQFPLGKTCAFCHSLLKWTIGLLLGLYSLFLTVQGISVSQSDGISIRIAKYAIGSGVPIVGGFLSGGVDMILAGSVLIKNAVGTFSVFLMLSVVLRPVLLVCAFQLFLRFSAALTETVDRRISNFFSDLANNLSYLIACIFTVSFVYFMTLILFILSSGVYL